MKKCIRCNITKEMGCYHKNKNKIDGANPICKQCRSDKSKLDSKIRKRLDIKFKKCNVCLLIKDIAHFSKDITTNEGWARRCKYCSKIFGKRYRENNPEITKKNNKKFKELNPEYYKEWRLENSKSISGRNRDWYSANRKDKSEKNKKWKRENPDSVRAYSENRRIKIKLSTPKYADIRAINKFKRRVPDDCHVDHIIPIINERVCGLHTLENLQYLTFIENTVKGSSFDGTNENESWRELLDPIRFL
jgi:hypothetical protein